MIKVLYRTSILLLISTSFCLSQQEMELYPDAIPNAREVPSQENISADGGVIRKVSHPTLTVYLPSKEKANGSAVLICPGGGYHALMAKSEGSNLAKVFNELGVAAFVLKYRLPSDEFQQNKSIAPLQDAQQAMMTIREGSDSWNINSDKIGIMGFSAGGHLAAMAGTQFESPVINNAGGISLRPDFMILIYPVISFSDSIGHLGSRNFLLGDSPAPDQLARYSNELHVKGNTPPTFITHGGDDTVVPVANSLVFFQALQNERISSELHIYAKGEHGYLESPSFEEWFGRVRHWMQSLNLIE